MKALNQRLFGSLSRRSRSRKLEILTDNFDLGAFARIVDVGAQVDGEFQLIDVHPERSRVVALNLLPEPLTAIHARYPKVPRLVGDARRLPFADKSIDLLYSSAVIEHVGDLSDQAAMADEVRRVARNWFITTPNRWYPFEFHTRLPLVGWLPAPAMMKVVRTWSYDHGSARYRSGVDSQTRLMTARELRSVFPESRVIPVRITFWPETLVVVGGELFSNPVAGTAAV